MESLWTAMTGWCGTLHRCLDLLDVYYQDTQAEKGDVPSYVLPVPHFKGFCFENGCFQLASAWQLRFSVVGASIRRSALLETRISDQARGEVRSGTDHGSGGSGGEMLFACGRRL